MKQWICMIILLAFAIPAACTQADLAPLSPATPGEQVKVPGGAYWDISPEELQVMLAAKDFTFINVHIPYEGEIAGTDLFIPYDAIEQHIDQLPADKGAKIVLYCRSDRMSRIAAETLVGMGYSHVWNLEGGMVAWERAGLPMK